MENGIETLRIGACMDVTLMVRHEGPVPLTHASERGDETVTDELTLLHLGSQLYEICRMLRRRIGELGTRRVLDAGASDGLFLREIGARRGVGVPRRHGQFADGG